MQEVPPWNGHQTKGSKKDLMYNNCIQDKYNEHPKRRTTTDICNLQRLKFCGNKYDAYSNLGGEMSR